MDSTIKVYGAEWCGDTSRTLAHLERSGLDYEFIDIDENREAEQKVERWGEGKRRIPVVEIDSNGETRRLTVPSNEELDNALGAESGSGGREEEAA